MVLEATMIWFVFASHSVFVLWLTRRVARSVDNSEWMRNGDFAPNRLEAQADAAIQISSKKGAMNPENTVGILTMAGATGCAIGVTATIQPTANVNCLAILAGYKFCAR
jgi:hypothetical protein